MLEDSVLTAASVEAPKAKGEQFVAPLMELFQVEAIIESNARSFGSYKDGTGAEQGICNEKLELPGFGPLDLELVGTAVNSNITNVVTTGFVGTFGWENVFHVLACQHVRRELRARDSS